MSKKIERTIDANSKMAALLEKAQFSPKVLARGEKVEGTVVAKLADSLLVDIGVKAEGIISLKELQDADPQPKVGDKIVAIIAQPENDSGVIVLATRRNQKEKVWDDFKEIMDRGEVVEVKGIEANRGGLVVEALEVRGFVPSSHLITSSREAIGKKLSVKVIEVDKNFNKLVFSEKEATPDAMPKIDLPFKIGDDLEVSVSKILPFGLLVTTGEIDGLIHISEISWSRVENLADDFKVGQQLKAKVISIDPATGKINLSIKQLGTDPWKEAAKKYQVGTVATKKVSRITSYGVFVELEKGIEGLLHSSKIPYGVDLKPGDTITVSIDLFNGEQRRVALRLAPTEEGGKNKEEAPPTVKREAAKKATKEPKMESSKSKGKGQKPSTRAQAEGAKVKVKN